MDFDQAAFTSSGHMPKAPQGLPALEALFKKRKELVEDDAWGMSILAGSGVNASTTIPLLKSLVPLGLREIHLSGGKWVAGGMQFKRSGMGMGANEEREWDIWRTDREDIRKVRQIADSVWQDYISSK